MSLLGNLLEISLSSDKLLEDIAHFETFDFQTLRVNEIRSYQYGVMGDGAIHFGLHKLTFLSPTLTFVLPDLSKHIQAIENLGIEFEFTHLSDDKFNEAGFIDESGQRILLLEARTFSPTLIDHDKRCAFGQFSHVVLPAANGNELLWNQLIPQEADSDASTRNTAAIRTDSNCTQLTLVFTNDIQETIFRGAREGWKNFSVTQDNHGLIKSPFGIHFLIRDTHTDE